MFELKEIEQVSALDRVNVRRLASYLENAIQNCLLDDPCHDAAFVRECFNRQAEIMLTSLVDRQIITNFNFVTEQNILIELPIGDYVMLELSIKEE